VSEPSQVCPSCGWKTGFGHAADCKTIEPSQAAIALDNDLRKFDGPWGNAAQQTQVRRECIDRYLQMAKAEGSEQTRTLFERRYIDFENNIHECVVKATHGLRIRGMLTCNIENAEASTIIEAAFGLSLKTPVDQLIDYLNEQFPATVGHIPLREKIQAAIDESK
jgi:hypothetical protein